MAQLNGLLSNEEELVGVLSISGEPINVPGPGPVKDKPYTSLERLGSYLYKVTYNQVPEEEEELNMPVASGCSSYVKDGKLFRQLDWNYDNTNEFLVVCKGFKGMSMIPGSSDHEIDDKLIKQLPYHINDGINDDGIMISSHVLYNDFDYVSTGNTLLTKIPYIVLNTLHSMDDIHDLDELLADIRVNNYLVENEYLMQFLITDGTTTYLITPSESGYELVDITANPKLANFKWVNRAEVDRVDMDIQLRPTGIERFNMMPCALEVLRFTKAYEQPNRLSEFIGLRDTDKFSTDEQLLEIYETAHQMYLERTRDGSLWQTMHSIVYSKNGIESLFVQENYDINYAGNAVDLTDYATKADLAEEVNRATIAEGVIDTKLDNAIDAFTEELAKKASKTYVDSQDEYIASLIPEVPANVSAFINDAGYLTSADNNIFIAEYGVTTQTEIEAAYNANKLPVVFNNNNLYVFSDKSAIGDYFININSYKSSSTHVITGLNGGCVCVDGSTWYSSSLDIQNKLTAGDNIAIENNVISAKGVKLFKYQQATYNEIWTAITNGYYPIVYTGMQSAAGHSFHVYSNNVGGILYFYSITAGYENLVTVIVLNSNNEWFIERRCLVPEVPDQENNYVLKCIAGVLTWVQE